MPRARAQGRKPVRVQERLLSELQKASLPVRGLATRQVLGHSSLIPGLCSEEACSRLHCTAALATGVVWAPAVLSTTGGSLRPSSVTAAASALCCCASLSSSAPRGGQRGPYWPTPLQLQPSGPSGECARPGAQPWAVALGRGLTDAHTGTGNSYLSKEWRNGDTGPLFLSTFGNWCRGGRRMGLGAESPHSPGRTQCCFQRDLLGRLLI